MKRGNRPSLDASNENGTCIILMFFNKVSWRLFSWNGNKWHTFIGGLEPYDLRFVWLPVLLVAARTTIAVLTFSFLLLFRCLTARA